MTEKTGEMGEMEIMMRDARKEFDEIPPPLR